MRSYLLYLSMVVSFISICSLAVGGDIDLAKKSTLETILKKGELQVGFNSGYMPFEMTNPKGRYVGFDIDIAKEMAKAMGVKFVPVNTAWDDIIPSLITAKFDIIMSGMTVTQERHLKINFASPYIIVGQTISINKKDRSKIKSYKDLNNPKYIVTFKLGTTGQQAVQRLIPKCTYKSFETEPEAALEVVKRWLTGKRTPLCTISPTAVSLWPSRVPASWSFWTNRSPSNPLPGLSEKATLIS
jgi:polar amino acid transport system substrate-binding protein